MEDILVFGEKDNFAIQLGLHPKIEKCKLCFFVKGKKIGTFTKGGELKHSINSYLKFINNKENYFTQPFESMTPTQICKYLVDDLFILGRSSNREKIAEYERRKKMHLFWGSQFTNDGADIILLYKDSEVKFIFRPPKKVVSIEFKISYNYFCNVFNKYIEYCNKNNLV